MEKKFNNNAEIYIVENIIDKLSENINEEDRDNNLLKELEYLSTLVTKDTRINNAIMELINILESKGLDSEFLEQINLISNLILSGTIEYEPINTHFINLYEKQNDIKGISLLSDQLNEITGGIHKGNICTVVGSPGSMKTTYTMNICYEAIKNGENVCFLSLEESPFSLYSKLLSRVALDLNKQFSVQDIIQHNLTKEEEKVLKNEVYPYLENLPGSLFILGENDLEDLSFSSIENKLNLVDKLIKDKNEDENSGISILVVDHLQMLKYVSTTTKDEYQVMNQYVAYFRKLSKQFLEESREVLVILISQTNREGISHARKKDGSYLLHQIAEASELERASSYIVSVYTDELLQMSKMIKLGAIKLRGSSLPIGTINTYADGKYYQIGNLNNHKVKDYNVKDLNEDNNQTQDLNTMLKSSIETIF